jgi:hypothetical protein
MCDLVAIIPIPICYAGRGKGIEARPHRPVADSVDVHS